MSEEKNIINTDKEEKQIMERPKKTKEEKD